MAFEDGRGEMRGKYAEDELVEDLLSQGEEWNYLKFQAAQDAADLRLQMKQNAITDQRWASNAAQAFAMAMLGKQSVSFPKAVSENVVSESVSKTVNDDSSLTASKDTLDNMVDRFSKDVDALKSLVADSQSQMTDILSTFSAILGRIEIEAE